MSAGHNIFYQCLLSDSYFEHCIAGDLNHINLDDVNFDEDDAKTVIYVSLMA